MPQSNPPFAFGPGANRGPNPRLTPEVLDADARARRVYRQVTDRIMPQLAKTPRRHHHYANRREDCPARTLTRLVSEIVDFTNCGATEAELRLVELFVRAVIDDCTCGAARRSLDAIDREELPLEGAENTLFGERRIAGDVAAVDPERLEEEADVNRREAAVQLERANVLEFTARRLRREREAAAPRRARDPQYPPRSAA